MSVPATTRRLCLVRVLEVCSLNSAVRGTATRRDAGTIIAEGAIPDVRGCNPRCQSSSLQGIVLLRPPSWIKKAASRQKRRGGDGITGRQGQEKEIQPCLQSFICRTLWV